MASTIFELPDELLATLIETFPCRDAQIRALATLVYPRAAPCRNLIVHGTEATGKSAITAGLLEALKDDESTALNYAVVKSAECVTARHLFERTVGLVADALQWGGTVGRCETLAALTVELSRMLKYVELEDDDDDNADSWRFVLVFDGIDRQREAPPTLLPALARLSEIIPNLTTLFILTTPTPSLLRLSSPPHLHFPPYTKAQYTTILSRTPPPSLPNTTQAETAELWTRFAAAVHDSLARAASRTLPSLRHACGALWPRFTAPVAAGTHRAREFSKLLVAARAYFQDESVLEPGIVVGGSGSRTKLSHTQAQQTTGNGKGPQQQQQQPQLSQKLKPTTSSSDLHTLLPPTARLLLVSAYLASHNAPRHDQTLFSTWHHGRRRRGGGVHAGVRHRHSNPKHRKIARKLLGPGVFVLERMVAIYVATRREWVGGGGDETTSNTGAGGVTVDGDVGMAIATLASLRLIMRVGGGVGAAGGGGGDMDRGGKWRVGVGWEVIRGVGRSMGVEVEEWLVE